MIQPSAESQITALTYKQPAILLDMGQESAQKSLLTISKQDRSSDAVIFVRNKHKKSISFSDQIKKSKDFRFSRKCCSLRGDKLKKS